MKKESIEKLASDIIEFKKEALKYNKDILAIYGLIDSKNGWGRLEQFGIDRKPSNSKDKLNVSEQISKDVGIAGAMRSMY